MPGLRLREDGWTAARTVKFLAVLAQTGCVTDAARVAGMSRKSVTDARRRFYPFNAACVEALAKAQRGLVAIAYQRAVEGKQLIIYRNGKEVERRLMPSDSMLALLLKRGMEGDAGAGLMALNAMPMIDPDTLLSVDEFRQGWRFDPAGVKYFHPTSALAKLRAKMAAMRERVIDEELEAGICSSCHAPLPAEVVARRIASRAADQAEAAAEPKGRTGWDG